MWEASLNYMTLEDALTGSRFTEEGILRRTWNKLLSREVHHTLKRLETFRIIHTLQRLITIIAWHLPGHVWIGSLLDLPETIRFWMITLCHWEKPILFLSGKARDVHLPVRGKMKPENLETVWEQIAGGACQTPSERKWRTVQCWEAILCFKISLQSLSVFLWSQRG